MLSSTELTLLVILAVIAFLFAIGLATYIVVMDQLDRKAKKLKDEGDKALLLNKPLVVRQNQKEQKLVISEDGVPDYLVLQDMDPETEELEPLEDDHNDDDIPPSAGKHRG